MLFLWVFVIFVDITNSLEVPQGPGNKNIRLVLKNVNYLPNKREASKGFDILDFSVYLPRAPGAQKFLTQTLGQQGFQQSTRFVPILPSYNSYTKPTIIPTSAEVFSQEPPKGLIGPFKLVKVESVPVVPTVPTTFSPTHKPIRYTDIDATSLKVVPTQSISLGSTRHPKDDWDQVQKIFETTTPKKLFEKYEALTASQPQYFSNPAPLKLYPVSPTGFTPIAERLVQPSVATHLKLTNHNYNRPKTTSSPALVKPYITVFNFSQEKDLSQLNPPRESYFKPLITPETVQDYPYFEALVSEQGNQHEEDEPWKLRKPKPKHRRPSHSYSQKLLHDSPRKEVLLNSVVYHPDEYTHVDSYRIPGHVYPDSYSYETQETQETQESQQHRPPPLRPPRLYINVNEQYPITKRADYHDDDDEDDYTGQAYSAISDPPKLPFQGIFKTISSFISNKTEAEDLSPKESSDPESVTQSTAEKAIQDEIKYFQDIFVSQNSPHELEFGHVLDSPKGSEERYERKDMKAQRHQGKVRWTDKKGGYGEHYWDLAHHKPSETEPKEDGDGANEE